MSALRQVASFTTLECPLVFYVTDRKSLPGAGTTDLIERIRIAASARCDFIQIRESDLPSRGLLRVAKDAVSAAAGTASTRILVNDRLDVALAGGASGVHLGGSSLPLRETIQYARHAATSNFLVGASCHSLGEASTAQRDGANYIFFGPVFDTPSKRPFGPPQGLDRLKEVCASVKIPVIAIGGMNEMVAAECIGAGASGIAAIRMFQEVENEKALAATIDKIHALKRT